MEKTLPIDMDPTIKTFPSIGNYLGILNAVGYDTTGIMINHFVDLFYAKKSVGFTQRDYIRRNKFEREAFHFSQENFIDKLREEINRNHYVLLILNELFVNNPKIHTDHTFCHDWLVYGYDDGRNIFKVMGYYGTSGMPRVFGCVEISYDGIKNGTFNALNEKHIYKDTDLDNHVFWVKTTNIEEQINIKKTKRKLKQYLKGQILFYDKQIFLFTGKNVMELLINQHKVAGRKLSDKESVYFDVRNYRFCLENKIVILLILKNYSVDLNLADKYEREVINNLNIVLILSAKYAVKPNSKINARIIKLLTKAQQAEKQILKSYLQAKYRK